MSPSAWLTILTALSVVLLAGAWLLTSLSRLSAAWNHLCWLFALVAPVLALAILSTGLKLELPVLPTNQTVDTSLLNDVSEVSVPETEVSSALVAAAPDKGIDISSEIILGLLWATGCALILGFLVVSHLCVLRKLRHARAFPIPERIQSAAAKLISPSGVYPEVLICDWAGVPFCYGFLRARIVLPVGATEWNDAMIRACLAHEFAHLRRHDLLSLALAQLGCAIMWFNPLTWFGISRLRRVAESAADDIAIEQPAVSRTYATQLLAVASHLKRNPFTVATFPMARPGQLRQRIEALTDTNRRREAPGIWKVVSLASLMAILLTTILAVELVAAEPEQTASQSIPEKSPLRAPDPRLSSPPVASMTMLLPGEIVALVNDVPITQNQLEQVVRPRIKAGAPSDDLVKQCLNDLIDRLLLLQEWDRLKERGAKIPQSVIEERIDSIIREEFGGDREKFLRGIEKNGYTLESFREWELIKIQCQAVKQTGIRNMFKDAPASSGEEFNRQREAWMKSLRDQAKIKYLWPKAGAARVPVKKEDSPSSAIASKSSTSNDSGGVIVAYIDDQPVQVPQYVAGKADFDANEAVDTELLSRLWKKQNGVVEDSIIDDRVNSVVEQEFSGSLEKFEGFLTANGSSLKEFKGYEKKKIAAQGARLLLRGKDGLREEQLKKAEEALAKIRSQSAIKIVDTEVNLKKKVSGVAATLANDTAFRNFGARPFQSSDGKLHFEADGWTWTALKGYGYSDLSAMVSSRAAQSEPRVEVNQLINSPW